MFGRSAMANGPNPTFGIRPELTTVVFRTDASREIGAGHVMRCLAFAKVLSDLDCRCVFAVSHESLETVPALQQSAYDVQTVDDTTENALETLGRFPDPVDWLIFDHYGIDATSETRYRSRSRNIMVIDDLANRPHDCDILLDQGPGRLADDYAGLVPEKALVLAGSAFALLDPVFANYRDSQALTPQETPTGIFISFGATDPHDFTTRALDALAGSGVPGNVNAVLGAVALHRGNVLRGIKTMNGNARLHIDSNEILGLLAESYFAMGAGGVSALERCCCGVPSLIAITADNQRAAAAGLAAAGAAQVFDLDNVATASNVIREFVSDVEHMSRISSAGRRLCDGRGARRAAMFVVPEASSKGEKICLRPATLDDENIILTWQKFPGARRYARNPEIPEKETHAAWMRSTLENPDILLNVIECEGDASGVLRLDRRTGRGKLPAFEVSLLIAPDRHRTGLGKAALTLARRLLPDVVLLADIHRENAASLALFLGAGYVEDGNEFASWPNAPHTVASVVSDNTNA